MAGAAREVGALRVLARNRAIWNPVPVHVEVAIEGLDLSERLGVEHLPAIRPVVVVPPEAGHDPVVHPDIEVGEHEDGRLEAFRKIERLHAELETLRRILRIQAEVLRVPVRRVGTEEDVALLGARRHPGRWADALDVEEDAGDLGVVRESDELRHERDTGPARRREGAGSGPPRADRDAGRREFVLRLKDRRQALSGLLLDAQAPAIGREGVDQRGRRRDRIPGRDRGARVDATQRRRRVTVDQNRVARGIHPLEPDRQGALEVLGRVVVTEPDRFEVRLEQVTLPLAEGLLEQSTDHVHVDVEEGGEGAGVGDVLHQDARAAAVEALHAHLGQRDAEEGHFLAPQRVRHGPARVVQEPAAGHELLDVLRVGLRVHRHDEVEVRRARDVARPVHPDFVPGGKALDVRGEDVLSRHRDPHAEDRLHDEAVGARGARTVHGADLEREVVHAVRLHVGHSVREPPTRSRPAPSPRSPSPSRDGPHPVPRTA